jgi:hypothetical protein
VGFIRPGANYINICGAKVELLLRYFLMLLMATSFGKKCAKIWCAVLKLLPETGNKISTKMLMKQSNI